MSIIWQPILTLAIRKSLTAKGYIQGDECGLKNYRFHLYWQLIKYFTNTEILSDALILPKMCVTFDQKYEYSTTLSENYDLVSVTVRSDFRAN